MKCRAGLSFIDVLIVINGIALLLAVAIPLTLSLAESARQSTCQMNLREISTVIRAYEGQYDTLPPAAIWMTPGMILTKKGILPPGTIDLSEKEPTNWQLDRFQSSFFTSFIDFWVGQDPGDFRRDDSIPLSAPPNHTFRSTTVNYYVCPSDNSGEHALKSSLQGGDWARGNYAVNAGPDPPCLAKGLPSVGFIPMPDLTCRTLYPQVRDLRGVELNPNSLFEVFQVSGSGVAGINKVFAPKHITDGIAKTIIIEEIVAGSDPEDRRGSWAMAGVGSSITFGHGSWNKGGRPNSPRSVDIIQNGSQTFSPPSDGSFGASLTSSPRSRHPGGIHVLFVDGTVSFIGDEIDPYVWTSLHTRDGQDKAPTNLLH